jgi:hypothetical protein
MVNRGGVGQRKEFQQAIKDLRRELEDGGLAWVHATESAGKYLQTVVSMDLRFRGTIARTDEVDV